MWSGAENLASTGVRPSERPARSDSLYRLRYPGPIKILEKTYVSFGLFVTLSRFQVEVVQGNSVMLFEFIV